MKIPQQYVDKDGNVLEPWAVLVAIRQKKELWLEVEEDGIISTLPVEHGES